MNLEANNFYRQYKYMKVNNLRTITYLKLINKISLYIEYYKKFIIIIHTLLVLNIYQDLLYLFL
jgi:hypothetical protein